MTLSFAVDTLNTPIYAPEQYEVRLRQRQMPFHLTRFNSNHPLDVFALANYDAKSFNNIYLENHKC